MTVLLNRLNLTFLFFFTLVDWTLAYMALGYVS